MKMKEVTSCTWTKIIEIKTRAKTPNGILRAIRCETDFDFDKSDVEYGLETGFIELCDDGIILWED